MPARNGAHPRPQYVQGHLPAERFSAEARAQIDAYEAWFDHALDLEQWIALLFDLAPDAYADWPQADEPTPLVPGDPDKISLMAERVAAGYSPFRAGDVDVVRWDGASYLPLNDDGQNHPERNGRVDNRELVPPRRPTA